MLFQALVVLLLIAAVLILAFAKAGGRLSVQRRSEPLRELDDFALETREIADHAGWEKRYTLRLPAVAGWGEELFAYLPHQYAQVWLGGEPTAASEEPDARHLGHSPGCYWLVLPVTEADSGAELTIVTQPCYRALADRDPRVLLASWDAVQGRLLGECLPEMLMSTICVVSGLLLVILAAALVFIRSALDLLRGRDKGWEIVHDCVCILFVLSALWDIYRLFHVGNSRFLMLFVCVTFLHLLIMFMDILSRVVERERKIYETEAQLAEERSRLMLSQIQPHFLYNSLGVIRELCHSDPDKAEDATVKFSEYLRRNMASLSVNEPVPFTVELSHTKNYLDLEKLRFGEALRVEYDIRAEDFRLPALTLQPIVENAVRHGARKQVNGGTVYISSEETAESFRLVVKDNGPGFEPGQLPEDGKEHVGLRNVQKRLEHFYGGCLRVESAPGQGTKVTIEIPKGTETKGGRGRAEPPQGLPAHAHRRSADGPRRDRHGGGADPAAPEVGGPAGPARLRLLSHARGRYGGAQQLPRRLYDALQLGRADRRQAAF